MTAEASAQTYNRAAVQRRTLAVMMAAVIPATAAMGSSFAASAVLARGDHRQRTTGHTGRGLDVNRKRGRRRSPVPPQARLGRRRGLVAGRRGSDDRPVAAVLSLYPLVVLGI